MVLTKKKIMKGTFFTKHLPTQRDKRISQYVFYKNDVYKNIPMLNNMDKNSYTFIMQDDATTGSHVKWDDVTAAALFLCSTEICEADDFRIHYDSGRISVQTYKCSRVEGMEDRDDMIVYIKNSTEYLVPEPNCIRIVGEVLTPDVEAGLLFTEKQSKYLTLKS